MEIVKGVKWVEPSPAIHHPCRVTNCLANLVTIEIIYSKL